MERIKRNESLTGGHIRIRIRMRIKSVRCKKRKPSMWADWRKKKEERVLLGWGWIPTCPGSVPRCETLVMTDSILSTSTSRVQCSFYSASHCTYLSRSCSCCSSSSHPSYSSRVETACNPFLHLPVHLLSLLLASFSVFCFSFHLHLLSHCALYLELSWS